MEPVKSTLKLVLHNVVEDSQTEHEFSCEGGGINFDLTTVSQVKEYVEAKHSIPVCCQTLFFQSRKLRDQDTLTQCCLREQDAIVVKYESTANVDDVLKILQILKLLVQKLEAYLSSPTPENRLSSFRDNAKTLRHLSLESFSDASRISDANRFLFVHRGGVEVFFKLYGLVLKEPYRDTIFLIRHLESTLVGLASDVVLYNGSKIPALKKHVVLENPTLDYILKSFMRVRLRRYQKMVAPGPPKSDWVQVSSLEQDKVLADYLGSSLINISK